MKRLQWILAACLAASVLGAGISGAMAAVTEPTVVYTENFDTAGGLPQGWAQPTPANGTAAVSGGRLVLTGTVDAGGNPAKNVFVRLPQVAADLKNFTYEIKFTIKNSTDGNTGRYIGFMYRVTDENAADPTYYHSAVRITPSMASGVEFGARTPAHGWNIVGKDSYNGADLVGGAIDPGRLYDMRIVVSGTRVSHYLNGVKLAAGEMAEGTLAGYLGIQICNLVAEVDSVKVTENPEYRFTGVAEEYSFRSDLISPPAAVMPVDSKERFDEIKSKLGSVRPQTAMFRIDSEGEAVDKEGKVIVSIRDAVGSLIPTPSRANPNPKLAVIPALYAIDENAADRIVEFCGENQLTDAFVVSDSPAILKKMRRSLPDLRGVLDARGYGFATDADLLKIRNDVNSSLGRVAILPAEASRFQIDYLQKRLVTVWTGEVSDLTSAAGCIARGSTGILSGGYAEVYSLVKSFPANSRAALPYIAAHRGNTYGEPTDQSTTFPANSIEGAKQAYKLGADAIESDVYVTTDNRLVIGHDNTLGNNGELHDGKGGANTVVKPSENRVLENMTLGEIKTGYYLRDGKCRIPTLDEYFEAFKTDKNVMHFVEIKSWKTNVIPLLKELADRYGVADQLVVIIFNDKPAQIQKMLELMPEISVGYLTQTGVVWPNYPPALDDLGTVLSQVCPVNATYNPHYSKLDASLANQLLRRGITTWEWTSGEGQIGQHFQDGYSGITTDFGHRAGELYLRTSAEAITLGADGAQVDLAVKKRIGSADVSAAEMIVVSGSLKLTLTDGKLTAENAKDNDTASVMFAAKYSDEFGLEYLLFCEPVTVTYKSGSGGGTEPPVKPEPKPEKGCNSETEAALLSAAAIVLLCGIRGRFGR